MLRTKCSLHKIFFVWQNFSSDKISITKRKFCQFCLTNFCPIRFINISYNFRFYHTNLILQILLGTTYFGPWVYQRGFLVIALVHWSVVSPPLDISETVHCFLKFFYKLEHHKVQKWQSPIFKKILGGSHMGENPNFWGIFDVFCSYLCI